MSKESEESKQLKADIQELIKNSIEQMRTADPKTKEMFALQVNFLNNIISNDLGKGHHSEYNFASKSKAELQDFIDNTRDAKEIVNDFDYAISRVQNYGNAVSTASVAYEKGKAIVNEKYPEETVQQSKTAVPDKPASNISPKPKAPEIAISKKVKIEHSKNAPQINAAIDKINQMQNLNPQTREMFALQVAFLDKHNNSTDKNTKDFEGVEQVVKNINRNIELFVADQSAVNVFVNGIDNDIGFPRIYDYSEQAQTASFEFSQDSKKVTDKYTNINNAMKKLESLGADPATKNMLTQQIAVLQELSIQSIQDPSFKLANSTAETLNDNLKTISSSTSLEDIKAKVKENHTAIIKFARLDTIGFSVDYVTSTKELAQTKKEPAFTPKAPQPIQNSKITLKQQQPQVQQPKPNAPAQAVSNAPAKPINKEVSKIFDNALEKAKEQCGKPLALESKLNVKQPLFTEYVLTTELDANGKNVSKKHEVTNIKEYARFLIASANSAETFYATKSQEMNYNNKGEKVALMTDELKTKLDIPGTAQSMRDLADTLLLIGPTIVPELQQFFVHELMKSIDEQKAAQQFESKDNAKLDNLDQAVSKPLTTTEKTEKPNHHTFVIQEQGGKKKSDRITNAPQEDTVKIGTMNIQGNPAQYFQKFADDMQTKIQQDIKATNSGTTLSLQHISETGKLTSAFVGDSPAFLVVVDKDNNTKFVPLTHDQNPRDPIEATTMLGKGYYGNLELSRSLESAANDRFAQEVKADRDISVNSSNIGIVEHDLAQYKNSGSKVFLISASDGISNNVIRDNLPDIIKQNGFDNLNPEFIGTTICKIQQQALVERKVEKADHRTCVVNDVTDFIKSANQVTMVADGHLGAQASNLVREEFEKLTVEGQSKSRANSQSQENSAPAPQKPMAPLPQVPPRPKSSPPAVPPKPANLSAKMESRRASSTSMGKENAPKIDPKQLQNTYDVFLNAYYRKYTGIQDDLQGNLPLHNTLETLKNSNEYGPALAKLTAHALLNPIDNEIKFNTVMQAVNEQLIKSGNNKEQKSQLSKSFTTEFTQQVKEFKAENVTWKDKFVSTLKTVTALKPLDFVLTNVAGMKHKDVLDKAIKNLPVQTALDMAQNISQDMTGKKTFSKEDKQQLHVLERLNDHIKKNPNQEKITEEMKDQKTAINTDIKSISTNYAATKGQKIENIDVKANKKSMKISVEKAWNEPLTPSAVPKSGGKGSHGQGH